MSDIVLTNVCKHWDSTTAVDTLNITIPAGTLTALLGPSGCGKSTTLRLIAGLEQVSAGDIYIGGKTVTLCPASQRSVSMVFQSYALFPHLSVAENIVFGLKVRRIHAQERAARLQRTAELLNLSGLLQRKPAELSGGQRQRVALGRAIVSEAPVCLMDEPLSNLDAQLRQHMRTEIRTLQQKLNITMVYVTHDQVEAMSMADQIILMQNGRVEQTGSPQTLYRQPASSFVARFIGAPPMNVLVPPAHISPPPHIDINRVLLGIRPEHIQLCPVHYDNCATITQIEYLGAESMMTLDLNGQQLMVRTAEHNRFQPSDQVGLCWQANDQHFFDDQSGQRICIL